MWCSCVGAEGSRARPSQVSTQIPTLSDGVGGKPVAAGQGAGADDKVCPGAGDVAPGKCPGQPVLLGGGGVTEKTVLHPDMDGWEGQNKMHYGRGGLRRDQDAYTHSVCAPPRTAC